MKKNLFLLLNRLFTGHDSKQFYLNKNVNIFLNVAIILFSVTNVNAALITINANTNWSAISPLPTIADDITIGNDATLTLNVSNAVCNSITIGVPGKTGSLVFNASSQVTVTSNVISNGNKANILNMSAGGTLLCGGLTLTNTNLTWTPGTGTVILTATNTLPATVFTTFNNLTLSAGTTTMGTRTVNGIFSIEGTATTTAAPSYGTNASLQYNSTAAITPGTEWVTPFTATGGVIIKNTGVVTLAVNKTVNLLTIAPNAKFTYNTGTLTVTTFNIQSDATGTGTYLGSGTLTATTTNVNQHFSAPRAWYMISPVATNTPVPNAGSLSLYNYLESADDDQTTGTSWLSSTTISPDQGYSVTSPSGTTNVTFTGALNNGAKSFTLTYNNHAGKSKNGFNLIGNPYPSYLDWTALYAANTALIPNATMYYRTKVGATYAFWTVNGSGIGTPIGANKNIPPMQAFWVRSTTSGGTLNLTNAMRLHETTGTNLMKAPALKTVDSQILRLQVSTGTTTDETVIYFNTNAANSFDVYDSPKWTNGSASLVPDIYTSVSGIEVLAINGINTIPYNTEIPLYFAANASSVTSFTITANEFSNFEAGTQVWIKNNLSGISQLVSDGSPYTFDLAETGANPKFSILIKVPGAATQLSTFTYPNVNVFTNLNNQITIMCNETLSNDAIVSVYNNLGQCLLNKSLKGIKTIINTHFKSGVYLVSITNSGNKITEKIIIR